MYYFICFTHRGHLYFISTSKINYNLVLLDRLRMGQCGFNVTLTIVFNKEDSCWDIFMVLHDRLV